MRVCIANTHKYTHGYVHTYFTRTHSSILMHVMEMLMECIHQKDDHAQTNSLLAGWLRALHAGGHRYCKGMGKEQSFGLES